MRDGGLGRVVLLHRGVGRPIRVRVVAGRREVGRPFCGIGRLVVGGDADEQRQACIRIHQYRMGYQRVARHVSELHGVDDRRVLVYGHGLAARSRVGRGGRRPGHEQAHGLVPIARILVLGDLGLRIEQLLEGDRLGVLRQAAAVEYELQAHLAEFRLGGELLGGRHLVAGRVEQRRAVGLHELARRRVRLALADARVFHGVDDLGARRRDDVLAALAVGGLG